MAKKFPVNPAHPERICWGCDKYCAVDSMNCGNGSDRAQHPMELFGDDWIGFGDESDGTPVVSPEVSEDNLARQCRGRRRVDRDTE